MYALGNGQRQQAYVGIALLEVGWDGIVYHCLYALIEQVLLQAVAFAAQHREYVVYAVLAIFDRRESKQRIVYMLDVLHGNAAAQRIVGIEILQFHPQHGCLNLVKSAVATFIIKHILALRTVIAQCANHISQLFVVGSDGTAIAKCPKVLAGLEAVVSCIAQ